MGLPAKDLAESNAAKAKELHDKLVAWRKSVNAQMPTPNPKHDPNAQPAKKKRKKKNSTGKRSDIVASVPFF